MSEMKFEKAIKIGLLGKNVTFVSAFTTLALYELWNFFIDQPCRLSLNSFKEDIFSSIFSMNSTQFVTTS